MLAGSIKTNTIIKRTFAMSKILGYLGEKIDYSERSSWQSKYQLFHFRSSFPHILQIHPNTCFLWIRNFQSKRTLLLDPDPYLTFSNKNNHLQ